MTFAEFEQRLAHKLTRPNTAVERRRRVILKCWTLLVVLAPVAMSGCGSSASAGPAQLSVVDPHTPAPASPDIGVLYFTVRNTGGTGDTLETVTTSVATSAEVHAEVQRGRMVTMVPVGPLPIPAHQSRTLNVGGTHVMLIGLDRHLVVGDHFDATLRFQHSPSITVTVVVVPQAS